MNIKSNVKSGSSLMEEVPPMPIHLGLGLHPLRPA